MKATPMMHRIFTCLGKLAIVLVACVVIQPTWAAAQGLDASEMLGDPALESAASVQTLQVNAQISLDP